MRIFREIFSDHTGRLSSMRLFVFLVVSNIMLVWTIRCFLDGAFHALPTADAAAIVGAIFGQVMQKKSELKTPPPESGMGGE